MKKYTFKYIPVEGEIGMGDHYLLFMHGLKSSKRRREETGEQFVITPRWSLHHFTGKQGDKLALLTNPSDRKRVKLFLCSSQIQIGEQAYSKDGTLCSICNGFGEFPIESSISDGFEECICLRVFRVVGEVSPIPPGIKLDQQVTEDQVRFMVAVDANQPDSYIEFNERTFLEHPELPRKIEIKMGV